MSKFVERGRSSTAVWSLALALALGSAGLLCADEPKCECKKDVLVHEECFPLLTRLPLIQKLFNVSPPTCNGPCCTEEVDHLVIDRRLPAEDAKRLGIFFDATGGPPARGVVIVKRFDLQQCAGGECAGACAASEAKQCTGGTCALTVQSTGASKCTCVDCSCKNCGCCNTVAAHSVATSKHGQASCSGQEVAWERVLKVTAHAAELAAERAALAAALEAQEQVLHLKTEMFEALTEAAIENAKLEAKLALVAERDESAKRVQDLSAENARLKTQIELANHREETTRQTMQLALENERLKLRVADLERHATSTRVGIVPPPPVR